MSINRFSNIVQPERFNPLSFEELSFAPIALRNREDTLMNQQDVLLNTLNNIEVPEIYQDQFNQESSKLRQRIEDMSSQLQSKGAGNLNILGEFRNLRNDFNQSISKSGTIGRAAAVDADIKANKDAYYKFALEQGWGNNPDLINQRWQEELEKYKQNLPTDLSKYKGQIQEMTPSQAPKSVDLADEMTKLSKILGENAEALKDFSLVPGPVNPETSKPSNFIIVNSEGQEVTNVPQLNSLKNYMEKQVLDPSSSLNANLRFRGMSAEDFLSQVDDLADVMTSVKQASGNSYAGQTAVSKPSSTGSRSSGRISKQNEARLVHTNNGSTRVQKSITSGNIKQQIRDLDSRQDLTPEEKNRELTRLNHTLVKRERLENSDNYKKSINAKIMEDNFFSSIGITSINDYNEFITSPEAQEMRQQVASAGPGAPGQLLDTGQIMAEYAQEKFLNISENLPDSAFNDFVINSSYYSLGSNKESADLNKDFGEAVQNLNLKAFATRGDLEIRDITNGDNPDEYTTIEHTDYESYAGDISNAGIDKVKYKFKGIETGGIAGKPVILFDVTADTGDSNHKYTTSLFLDNNAQSKDLLRTLEETLDPVSASVIRGIKDNLEYGDISTTVSEGTVDFDDISTTNVLEHARKRDMSENVIGYTGDGIDNYKFVKKDGSKYSITVNPDNSYSTFKQDSNGNVYPLTFNDHFKRSILPGIKMANPDRNISTISREQEAISAINYLNSLIMQQENGIDFLYNPNEPEFQRALEDFNTEYNSTNNIEARKDAALRALDRIKGLRVFSKSIKEIL